MLKKNDQNLPAILTPAFTLISTQADTAGLSPELAAELDDSDNEGFSASIPRPAKVTIRNAPLLDDDGKAICDPGGFKFYSKAFDGTLDANGQEGLLVTFLMETKSRTYFPKGWNGSPPCRSWDAKTGRGNPGGACNVCPLTQWPDGKSEDKAPPCREEINLLAYDHSMKMIYYFQTYRTGIGPYLTFREVIGKTPPHALKVRLTTKYIKDALKPYFIPVFTSEGELSLEEFREMRAMRQIARESFEGGVKADGEEDTGLPGSTTYANDSELPGDAKPAHNSADDKIDGILN